MNRSWMHRLRSRVLPVPAISPYRFLSAWAWDVLHPRHPHDEDPLPPTRFMFDGSQNEADFRRDGAEFLRHFVELGGLLAHHRVLEIGSAIGRKAVPLTHQLDASGSYEGFDIVALGIDWCRQNITPRHPNFRFQHADVFNSLYNEAGRVRASEYRFPFDDASFDFAFATSVFTHMLPDELSNYVGELARVMAPGSQCLVSMLLLNEEAELCIDAGRGALTLRHRNGVCRTENAAIPEAAVGYPETVVRELLASKGLALVEPIHFGSWCGRERGLSFQDLVIARRL